MSSPTATTMNPALTTPVALDAVAGDVVDTDRSDVRAEAFARVGALAHFGIEYPWQAALFLPESYLDACHPDRAVTELDKKERRTIRLTVASTPGFGSRHGPPQLQFAIRDCTGASYKASVFGETKVWRETLTPNEPQLFLATASEYLGNLRVTIHAIVPSEHAGWVIPQYSRHRNPNAPDPEALRQLIAQLLPHGIPIAAQHIATQLETIAPLPRVLHALNARNWSMEQLLQHCHYPRDPAAIAGVRLTLMRLAALGSLASARSALTGYVPNPIQLQTLASRTLDMPFKLTNDQTRAIGDIAADLANTTRAGHRVIAGDTGVGKTAVAGVIAAAVADAGRRVMVLFPSTLVAVQAHAEFRKWFPDLPITLVTGDTGGEEHLDARILMGTSALLHRDLSDIDVLIVDEQHKWSREQREFHRAPHTHLIELSATCIPRTQALARFGSMAVTEMRETHQPKFIATQLWIGQPAMRDLMGEIRYVIRQGMPVVVIYPKREKSEDDDHNNIEAAAERWEAVFPGQVVTLTGNDSGDAKTGAMEAIRSGTKKILLCTTVVEVGVDLQNLRHIVIIDPQRYGLVQLHQLRGRVARAGGEGWCHLLAPSGLPLASKDRLQPFLETTDGFRIAEADLRHRGAGDLGAQSQRQHGAEGNFLHGNKIPLEIYDEVLPVLEELLTGR